MHERPHRVRLLTELTHAGGAAVRTPLLPLATLDRLTGGAARAAWLAGASGDVEDAVRRDLAALRAGLRDLVARPDVRTAIALASPSLDAALDDGDALDDGTTLRAVLGYVSRMAGRPAPFGLFAGSSPAGAEGTPSYDAGPVATRTRLDVEVLAQVAGALLADPAVRAAVPFRPNSTLHVAGGRLRLVERAPGDRYHPLAVEPDDALTAALDAARDGATIGAIAAALTDDDVSVEDATAYVGDLVAAQLLVPDLGPLVTGADPAALVAAADPATAHAVREATALDAKIVAPQAFRDLSARVRALAPGIAADRTLHVDSTREGSRLTLGDAVLAEAYRAVGVLHPLARVTASDEDLARFRTAFSDRYGDAEVPLLTALDDETGIGYGAPTALAAAGAPLLAGLNPAPSTEGEPWTPVDHHLVDLLSRALRTGARELELGPADLGPLRNQDKQPLAEALAVVATVAAASAEAVAAGEFRLVVHGAYADGAGLVARFDPDLVARHVAAEEALRPGAAYAEVVHLPDGRNANVAVRPALRRYAIPVLGLPGGGERIGLDDLRVSVRDGRVVLRSVRLRREVVPRLTAAHDYRTTRLPVYRFLGAVGHDRTAAVLRWSWGQLGSAPYLPRVTVGRLVLARAQWRWFRADLAPLQDARTTAARYAALQALRDEWDVPRWVALARGEQELPLDLDGVGAAELLGRAARTAGQLILRELLPGPDDLCVTSAEGALVHDFVLPVTRRAPAREPRAATVPREPGAALLPGREWLGVRLLTGAATADAVLREVVAPLAMASDEWWYERRPDAVAPHLLLRLRGDAALHAALLDRAGPLVAEGRVHGVELDTYRPEPADAVAHADSVAALLLVTAYGDLDARWRAALWGIDGLLESAGIDVASRRALVRDWRDDLVARYGETGARAHRYAGRVHRQRRTALEAPDATTAAVLAQRADAVRDALADAGDDVLRRVASRHVNRLLRAAHGVQELVLYDLLDRTYAARLSRD